MTASGSSDRPLTTSRIDDQLMTVMVVYPWPDFWSMGDGCGAPSFHQSVTCYVNHGHETHVLLPGPTGSPREEDYHGANLHRIPTNVSFMPEVRLGTVFHHVEILFAYLYWFMRAIPAGRALAARVEPDVIVGMGSLGAPVARVLARSRGIPNVTRLFGTELNVVPGRSLKYLLRYRDIEAYRTPASYIIACNDGSGSAEVARRLGVDMERFRHWLNGVDKAAFMNAHGGGALRRKLGIPDGNRVVLSVSRLHPEKGVDRLVHAVPEVSGARRDVTFLIVGSGEQSGELRALAERLGVLDHVVFAGAVSREELPDYYAAADLFVTLSERTNVLNPLHEAMISGLPVIALDTGGTGGIVHDGETGVLLSKDELDSLPRAILDLLGDRERMEAIGKGARESADRNLLSLEERQAIEVEIVERAVAEFRRRA